MDKPTVQNSLAARATFLAVDSQQGQTTQMTDGELDSWKEIADYLGVSVRTAQKWEQGQGLPVRRMHGERGRVFALRSEIDAWKLSPGNTISYSSDPHASSATAPYLARLRPWKVILVCVVLVLLTGMGFWLFRLPGQPANWRVERNALVITDSSNHEVWHWNSDLGLDPSMSVETNERNRLIWIGDLDGDGGNETLFVPPLTEENFFEKNMPLICFDRRGKERWRFGGNLGLELPTQAVSPGSSLSETD